MPDLDVRDIDEDGTIFRQLTLEPSINYQRQGTKEV